MSYKRSRREFEGDLQRQESPFVYYGTPLPPLDEHARDDGSYVPAWKQEVTDDRGRKRLHGAFTGGFSAGYFNTVGSKEGWTPSTFVSSRKNRATLVESNKQMKPEDFMDEEDLRELEESRNLATTGGFAGFGTEADPAGQDALADLFRTSDDSIGIKLLNRMGWREGQGIGPRVRRQVDPEDPSSDSHSFAPDDIPILGLNRKADFKGLGYEGEVGTDRIKPEVKSRNPVHAEEYSDSLQLGLDITGGPERTMKQKRTNMGVGILNDTGSDDEDPYEMGPKISYNRTLGGDKRAKKKPNTSIGAANPMAKTKPVFVATKSSVTGSNILKKCHDGHLPLSGFILVDELDDFKSMSLSGDKYKPEQPPEDWKPLIEVSSDSHTGNTSIYTSTSDAAKASTHTAKSRAITLGESTLPGKSVFDFLSPAARDRLAAASGRSNLPPALNEAQSSNDNSMTASNPLADLVPNLDPSTAQAALDRGRSGFMPYSDDLPKRQRYQKFLERCVNTKTSKALPPRAYGHSNEDWANEMHEFARAAQVFKPVTGLMASRFTSAADPSTSSNQKDKDDPDTKDLLSHPSAKPPDPAEEAARYGMFGLATRTRTNFYPSRLLCKRFGVSLPDHVTMPENTPSALSVPQLTSSEKPNPISYHSVGDRFRAAGFQQNEKSEVNNDKSEGGIAVQQSSTQVEQESILMSRSVVTVDPDRNEALEQEKPGAAVFRAIFGNDSEEDDDDDDDK